MASSKPIAPKRPRRTRAPKRSIDFRGLKSFRLVRAKRIDGRVGELKRGVNISRHDAFLRKSGLPAKEVNHVIQLRPRTLARRRVEGRLSQAESERLYRLSVVFEKAVELNEGSVEEARRWMSVPKAALAGQTPLEMCTTEVGAREVEDLIGRLEHGVFS